MNEAEKIISELQEVFNLTSMDNFEKVKKVAKGNVAKGYSSKAASSGDDSKAASSGNYSTAASSGYYSTAASSGNYSTAASSGDDSKAASSGYGSTAASSGDDSKAASSGDDSKAASSGYGSKAASSGDASTAASSGNYSTAASSGDASKASATGENVCAFACGRNVMAKASKGGGIALSEYNDKGKLVAVKAAIVDGKKLRADEWYKLEGGKFVWCDYSDNILSRVKSMKKVGQAVVKTVVIDGQKKQSYVYILNGKSAHGETVAKAKADLRYKIADRDTSKFKEWDTTEKRSIDDLIEAYRVITGACASGTKAFVESQKNDDKELSVNEVIELTKGAYGNEQFKEFFA